MIILGHALASDPRKSKADLKDTVEVDFNQLPDSTYTVMTVCNGYGRQLQYKAYRLSPRGDEIPASVRPVLLGIFAMESWPGPVLEIELSDLQLADTGSTTIACK